MIEDMGEMSEQTWLRTNNVRSHNHITRDIKRKGLCPACDLYLSEYQFPEADSEGNYHN